ncbi:potassium-transporting ATPase subunit KdpA [Amnibacterium kyonggiense]|uniref:Potassium-transporting ATPase potassium-binding subunit n=1 Tax=Amnibacterium kyonggiense TaxID=595671 RepID=A0A4R7FP16_9MICO|nr:potassium-transporting ATPase subunit KdpA [Amnibacterium kyonggiense]TDS79475.1 K+-transporting ATPase ATPase A chain [Amnibacterium kyonggiense]
MNGLLFALTVLTLVVALVALGWPLSTWMARTYTTDRDWLVERGVHRLLGIDARSEQRWPNYLRGILAISVLGVLLLYGLQRLQQFLPYSLGLPAVPEGIAFNTAISFVTNTNWQSYSPETTMGYTVQLAGLAVQNFLSAAIGIVVAVALIRGLASRTGAAGLGNVWVDLIRTVTRILLPMAFVAAIVLLATGVIQNFDGFRTVHTITGGTATIPGGPVASQEAIKELGTNGGGFFNANSAHPFENPTGFSNLFEIVLMLLIPFSLTRTFGIMVGDKRQGRAVLASMVVLYVLFTSALVAFEAAGAGSATAAAGAAMEGKEQRFGVLWSALFGSTSTITSTGAVNAMHDSFTPLGGMMAMLNMMLGEIAPGGVGTGLYGFLVIAILAVFLAGLMIGRTPTYLGKRIAAREITFASLYLLTTPTLILAGLGLTFAIPAVAADVAKTSIFNTGPHGFSEVLYAFTSAANNNGSAFGGLTANTAWLNPALGAVMWLGRYLPIVFVLALAGSFASQETRGTAEAGGLDTHRPQFVVLTVGTVLIVTALTYLPVLALGPLAEGLA